MSLVEEGSNMFSVRLKHFLGVLYDYEHLPITVLTKLVEQAKKRESYNINVSYHPDVEKALNELARMLS